MSELSIVFLNFFAIFLIFNIHERYTNFFADFLAVDRLKLAYNIIVNRFYKRLTNN